MDELDEATALPPELTLDEFRARLSTLEHPTARDAIILSDIDRAKLAQVRRIWPTLPREARKRLTADIVELGETSIEYNFSRVLKVALRDDDAEVRARAITGLWEDEGEDLLAYLLDDALRDPVEAVREAAVQALARFSQLAVEDKIGERWRAPLREALLTLVRGAESPEIRRRALEALAVYIEDAEVAEQIARAYASSNETIQMSALYAMGRNLDGRWLDTIIAEMDSDSPGLRYEATKASGEFGDRRAVPQLIERLGDDDREVQLAAIGSLGQIGGNASLNILKRLAGSKDDVVREAADEALDEASFISNPIGIGGRLERDDG